MGNRISFERGKKLMVWIVSTVIFLAASVFLGVRVIMFRSALRDIRQELELNRETGYNRQITIPLFDADLSAAAAEMNRCLDFQKKLKFETERKERYLKESVSNIAHDLRTPLTVIKGNLQLLGEEEKLTEKGVHRTEVCCERADSMKNMADEFFELALLESDSVKIQLENINATALLMQFIADSESVIRQSGLEPVVVFPEKTVFIKGDESMVQRMLGNLLNNVVRYAYGGFRVELTEKGGIIFSNKVGDVIPDVTHIFDRTYRADRSRSGKGTGLGLYIVKILAEKQDAEVSAEIKDGELFLGISFSQQNF